VQGFCPETPCYNIILCNWAKTEVGVMLIKEFVEAYYASNSMGNEWQRRIKWRGLR